MKHAIDVGYRHIDTAFGYNNEEDVGQGIRAKLDDGTVKREELYVVTKLPNTHHHPEHVERACRLSLRKLGLDYVDLYLMHTPMGWKYLGDEPEQGTPTDSEGNLIFSDVDYVDTWKAMEKLVVLGLVKSIGVSNFNSQQLARLMSESKIVPVTNQVECGPTITQDKLRAFCAEKGILLTAFTPLGRMKKLAEDGPEPAVNDPRVIEIGKKYKKTPAQVVLRYLTQLGVIPIPKSANKTRVAENLNIFDFELTEDEMKILATFNTGARHCPFLAGMSHPHFPFHVEF